MNKQSYGIFLNGQIAISVAESSDIESLDMSQDNIRSLVIELSRQILNAGGRMIYGGKLNKGGFTELFKDFVNQYDQEQNEKEHEVYFTNYLAWPYCNNISEKDKVNYESSCFKIVKATSSEYVGSDLQDMFIAPTDVHSRYLYSTSMTAMRLQAEQNADARILVGGKINGFSGCMPGIVEEFLTAKRAHHPVFLLGGFGGATKIITDIIEKKNNVSSKTLLDVALLDNQYKSLYDFYAKKNRHIDVSPLDEMKMEDLDNGLTEEQNLQLFHTTNTDDIIKLVLTGLNAKLNQ